MTNEPKKVGDLLLQELVLGPLAPDSSPEKETAIELTAAEEAAAIAAARARKAEIIHAQQKEREREEKINRYSVPWSMATWVDFIRHRMKFNGFRVDGLNMEPVNALLHYFNNSVAFENFTLNSIGQEMKLEKGLYIWGTVGVGKTSLLKLFEKNKRQCYQVYSCRKIVTEYVKYGPAVTQPFGNVVYNSIKNIENFWQETQGVCFDDLGTESESANNYGNKINVLEQIILDRYDNRVPREQTHITSNLSPEMIREVYGDRVASRMREQFNIIELKGPDRRA